MAILTREKILAAQDTKRLKEHVPEWGGEVWLQSLNGHERARYQQITTTARRMTQVVEQQNGTRAGQRRKGQPQAVAEFVAEMDTSQATLYLVAVGAVDGDGVKFFGEARMDELGTMNAEVLEYLAGKILDISGLGQVDDEEEEETVTPLPVSSDTSTDTPT